MNKSQANCLKKKSYATRDAAGFFANADGMRPYHCPHCDQWHLSSQRVQPYRDKVYEQKRKRAA